MARASAEGKSTEVPVNPVKTEEVDEALSFISGANRVVRRPLHRNGLRMRHEVPPPPGTPSSSSTPVSSPQNDQRINATTTAPGPQNSTSATGPPTVPGVDTRQEGFHSLPAVNVPNFMLPSAQAAQVLQEGSLPFPTAETGSQLLDPSPMYNTVNNLN